MLGYLGRRFAAAAMTLALACAAVFASIHLLPGDPVAILLGEQAGADPEVVQKMRGQLGLDRPLAEQFLSWIGGLATGDLGRSLRTGEPVFADVMVRLPRSLELIGGGLSIAILLGLPLGVVAARGRGRSAGTAASVAAIAGFSAPVFVSGIILVIVFSLWLDILPSSGFVEFAEDPITHIACLVLPATAIGINFMGVVARMTRASLSDTMTKEYVRLARAKGLSRDAAILKHALPNALVPVIAVIGIRAGNLLGGTVIVEALFDWPGLSSMLVSAVFARDYPVIQGALVAIFAVFVLIGLAIDTCQGIVDPRIRESAA
ncbi:MAG: ABC transporter permease [Alphaproteobacteria bacterium]|nr:ABC transporter permease [Alphaproteobacteria bacterium]